MCVSLLREFNIDFFSECTGGWEERGKFDEGNFEEGFWNF